MNIYSKSNSIEDSPILINYKIKQEVFYIINFSLSKLIHVNFRINLFFASSAMKKKTDHCERSD